MKTPKRGIFSIIIALILGVFFIFSLPVIANKSLAASAAWRETKQSQEENFFTWNFFDQAIQNLKKVEKNPEYISSPVIPAEAGIQTGSQLEAGMTSKSVEGLPSKNKILARPISDLNNFEIISTVINSETPKQKNCLVLCAAKDASKVIAKTSSVIASEAKQSYQNVINSSSAILGEARESIFSLQEKVKQSLSSLKFKTKKSVSVIADTPSIITSATKQSVSVIASVARQSYINVKNNSSVAVSKISLPKIEIPKPEISANIEHVGRSITDLFVIDRSVILSGSGGSKDSSVSPQNDKQKQYKYHPQTASLIEQIDSNIRLVGSWIVSLFTNEDVEKIAEPVKIIASQVTSPATTSAILQPTPVVAPVREIIREFRTETVVSNTSAQLSSLLADFEQYKISQQKMVAELSQVSNVGPRGNVAYTIGNPTFTGTAQGLGDDDIPNDITIGSGGNGSFDGNLTVGGNLNVGGIVVDQSGQITGVTGATFSDKIKVGTDTVIIDGVNNYITSPSNALSIYTTSTPLAISALTATGTWSSYFTGNFGIGTTTPGSGLSVQATSTLLGGPTYIYGQLTLPNFFATSTTATSTFDGGVILARSAGSVGIGTSSPSAYGLNVAGNLLVGGTATSSFANGIKLLSGCILMPDGSCAGGSTLSNITESGSNTGISSTSPGSALEVGGFTVIKGNLNVEATSTVSSLIATSTLEVRGNGGPATPDFLATEGRIAVASSTPYGLFSVEANSVADANTPIFVIGDQGTSTPFIYVSGNSGFVGVATDSPGAALAVDGNAIFGGNISVTGVVDVQNSGTTTYSGGVSAAALEATTGGLVVSGGETYLTGGDVGVGTTSPGALFGVAGFGLFKGNLNIEATSTLGSLNATTTVYVATSSPTVNSNLVVGGPAYVNSLGVGAATTSPGGLFVKGSAVIKEPVLLVGATTQTATEVFLARKDQNARTFSITQNATDGTGASALVQTRQGSGGTLFGISIESVSNSYTSSGVLQAGTGVLHSDGPNGMIVGTSAAVPILFYPNSAEAARFLSGGALLIGGTAQEGTERFLVRKDQNAQTYTVVRNATDGTAASSGYNVREGTGSTDFGVNLLAFSTSFTSSGVQQAGMAALYAASAPNGLLVGTDSAVPLSLWTNNAERARFNGYGNFGFGTTSPFGQVAIEATTVVGSTTPIFVVSDQGTSSPFIYVNGIDGAVGIATTTNLAADTQLGAGLSVATSTYVQGGLGVGAATTSAGGLFVKGSADIYDGLVVRGGGITNNSTATSTWANGGISVAGGGLASSQGLTVTGGDIVSSGKLTVTSTATSSLAGGLSITSVGGLDADILYNAGAALSVGKSGQNTQVTGAILTLQSVGAGNDIVFSPADGVGISTSTIGLKLEVAGFGVVKGNWNVEATSTVGSLLATTTAYIATTSPSGNFQFVVGGNAFISGTTTVQEIKFMESDIASSTPNRNTLYANNIVKAWINFESKTVTPVIAASFNVSSLTDNGAGDITINWSQGFSDDGSITIGNCRDKGSFNGVVGAADTEGDADNSNVSRNSIRLYCINVANGTTADPDWWAVMSTGNQ